MGEIASADLPVELRPLWAKLSEQRKAVGKLLPSSSRRWLNLGKRFARADKAALRSIERPNADLVAAANAIREAVISCEKILFADNSLDKTYHSVFDVYGAETVQEAGDRFAGEAAQAKKTDG